MIIQILLNSNSSKNNNKCDQNDHESQHQHYRAYLAHIYIDNMFTVGLQESC